MTDFNIDTLVLARGSHDSTEDGMCVMEAVAFVAGEKHTDHPKCASKVIGAFLRSWNDSLNDSDRQFLKPYIPRLVGTEECNDVEFRRSYMAMDWYIRTFTPSWLELAGLHEHAAACRTLQNVNNIKTLMLTHEVLSAAESAAESAAYDAIWSATWSAAESAAESAARNAAMKAARNAAESAAESAAYDAIWSATWSATWSAAESAAYDAAMNATWNAARNAARNAAMKAARNAAMDGTVKRLQKSALDLLDRMIECTEEK